MCHAYTRYTLCKCFLFTLGLYVYYTLYVLQECSVVYQVSTQSTLLASFLFFFCFVISIEIQYYRVKSNSPDKRYFIIRVLNKQWCWLKKKLQRHLSVNSSTQRNVHHPHQNHQGNWIAVQKKESSHHKHRQIILHPKWKNPKNHPITYKWNGTLLTIHRQTFSNVSNILIFYVILRKIKKI